MPDDPAHLFRRYFVNTLFDANFVVIGILAAEGIGPHGDPLAALRTMFAACTAIGISTGISVFEAEHVEDALTRQRMERAMMRPLEGSQPFLAKRRQRLLSAAVNASAPLVVLALTAAPLLLFMAGILPSFLVATLAAVGIAFALIAGAGYALGRLAGLDPWRKALRMSLAAAATFGLLFAIEVRL